MELVEKAVGADTGGIDDAVIDQLGEGSNEVFGTQQLVPVGPKFHIDVHSHVLTLNPHAAAPSVVDSQNAVRTIRRVQDNIQWFQGDLFNLIEATHKDEASQIIDAEETGMSSSTVRNLQWVAEKVPEENRIIAPTWSHAQAVASLTPLKQRKWLEKAREEDWSVAKLKSEVAASEDGGKHALKFIVVCVLPTEAKMNKVAEQLEAEGYTVTKRTAVATKERKRAKKHEITARKRRGGGQKMNTKRRKD